MEYPTLGEHCTVSECKQLDFLPLVCDACRQVFCKVHFHYSSHNCSQSYQKQRTVPDCPLCQKPIPIAAGSDPNVAVSAHIDTDCTSDPAKAHRGKVYSNRCSHKGCKTRELIPFRCPSCRYNFCVKHRNELDHQCGKNNKNHSGSLLTPSPSGAAATKRLQASTTTTNTTVSNSSTLAQAQRGLSDQAALQLAMKMSAEEDSGTEVDAAARRQQEEADRQLAEHLQAQMLAERRSNLSSNQQQRPTTTPSSNQNCRLS